jgi:hypothetical protein
LKFVTHFSLFHKDIKLTVVIVNIFITYIRRCINSYAKWKRLQKLRTLWRKSMFYNSFQLITLYSRLVKKNIATRSFTQELFRFNDFWISRFDASKKYVLFDSLCFTGASTAMQSENDCRNWEHYEGNQCFIIPWNWNLWQQTTT